MKWIETITPKQAAEELGVPYHGWMREMDRAPDIYPIWMPIPKLPKPYLEDEQ